MRALMVHAQHQSATIARLEQAVATMTITQKQAAQTMPSQTPPSIHVTVPQPAPKAAEQTP